MVSPEFQRLEIGKPISLVEVNAYARSSSVIYIYTSIIISACCNMFWASASWLYLTAKWFAILNIRSAQDALKLMINCRRCWQRICDEFCKIFASAASRYNAWKTWNLHEIHLMVTWYDTASSCNRLESEFVNWMLGIIFFGKISSSQSLRMRQYIMHDLHVLQSEDQTA
jgi:hypothetical protein